MSRSSEGYKLNPLKVSEQAVTTTLELLKTQTGYELSQGQGPWSQVRFSDLFTDLFQWYRIGLGFGVDIPEVLRAKYGVAEAMIKDSYDEVEESYQLYILAVGFMRAFVLGSFIEQGKLESIPLHKIEINWPVIDAVPGPAEAIPTAYASREGMYVIEQEALEAQWMAENPELYNTMLKVKEEQVNRLMPKVISTLEQVGMQKGFIDEMLPNIRSGWDDIIIETALRAYAIMTPNQPDLIPVPVKKDNR